MAGIVAAGAVQAGVLSLISQAGVSLINNKGDLGKVMQELGSKESVRNLAAAIITGGVLAGMGMPPTGLSEVGAGAKDFLVVLQQNLQAQAATALIQSVVNGADLKDSLQQALVSALINTVGAKVADGIGTLKVNDVLGSVTHKMAHAIAGCALGAAKAGDKGGCAPGAIGAVVGELMAEAMGQSPELQNFLGGKNEQVYMAGLFASLAGAMAGGTPEDIAIANWAGANAAANNYLSHNRPSPMMLSEKERFEAAVQGCANGDASACATRDSLTALSRQRDQELRDACSGSTPGRCAALANEAAAMGNMVQSAGGVVFANSPDNEGSIRLLDTATAGPSESPFTNSTAGQMAQSTATGLGLAAPTGFSGAGTVGVEAFNAYRHAAAGYSLLAGAGTGAVVGGGTYLGGLLLGPTSNEGGYLTDVTSRFSAVQLGTSMAIGAATGMYSTSMFGWAGVPNSVMNLTTVPGIVIRANAFGISKAAEAATADFQGKE